jgi:hypothetical protein
MKKILLLEDIAQTVISFYAIYLLQTGIAWYWWLLLFLCPDISMLGYLINTKIGAYTYNFFHHKLTAVVVIITGLVLYNMPLQAIGLLLYGHASFDRVMGYGLKYTDSFKHTHMGMLK